MRPRRSVNTGNTTLAEESPLPPQLPSSSRIEAPSVVHASPVASVFPAVRGAVYAPAMPTATTCSPPTPAAHMPYARSITASASAVAHKAGVAHPRHTHHLYADHDLGCASVVSRSRRVQAADRSSAPPFEADGMRMTPANRLVGNVHIGSPVAAGLGASAVPAGRAASVDQIRALRAE
jgi:hypothetical protein